MISEEDRHRVNLFVGMSAKERENMEKNRPDLFREIIKLQKLVMSEWEIKFGKRAYLREGIGKVRKNLNGKMEHPFKPGLFVAFWPQPYPEKISDAKTAMINETPIEDGEKQIEPARMKKLLHDFLGQ